MDNFLQAAIKGYWRMGATIEEICGVTGLHHFVIKRLIIHFKINENGKQNV